jgi:hypothetical protein
MRRGGVKGGLHTFLKLVYKIQVSGQLHFLPTLPSGKELSIFTRQEAGFTTQLCRKESGEISCLEP